MKYKVKTIDVQAREWFDKINGNSYHSVGITVNFGMPDAESIYVPMTYGYDDHYKTTALKALVKHGFIKTDDNTPLWRYCDERKVILRASIERGCKKRDVVAFGDPTNGSVNRIDGFTVSI